MQLNCRAAPRIATTREKSRRKAPRKSWFVSQTKRPPRWRASARSRQGMRLRKRKDFGVASTYSSMSMYSIVPHDHALNLL
ncbi:MAG TPA: hypothetical protein DCG89_02450, partial [Spartobacteria bacterium]|nr:hypothetical protein [Spartobacteria bacterium]